MASRKPTAAGPQWSRGRPTGLPFTPGVRRLPCPIQRLAPLQEQDFDEYVPGEFLERKWPGSQEQEEGGTMDD